jgi:hypothetical protein
LYIIAIVKLGSAPMKTKAHLCKPQSSYKKESKPKILKAQTVGEQLKNPTHL